MSERISNGRPSAGGSRWRSALRRWWSRVRPGAGAPDAGPAGGGAGAWGEREAERLLRGKGWRLLGRNVRVGRRGEIDLLFRDRRALVFVEVKTRAHERYGRPSAAVNFGKRRRLSKAAMRYVRGLREKPDYLRFDVVEVIGSEGGSVAPVVRHIENAFPLEGRYFIPW